MDPTHGATESIDKQEKGDAADQRGGPSSDADRSGRGGAQTVRERPMALPPSGMGWPVQL
jgi:hypothetical protein